MTVQQWSKRIWLAQVTDDPSISEDLSLLLEQLGQAQAKPDVVLDLSAISHLNSSNLSQLLRLRKAMLDYEARLLIAGTPTGVWAVFLLTGLDKIFEFAPDVATALAAAQMPRSPQTR